MAETNNNLSELVYIQSNLKVSKDKYNDFGSYHYRSCEDILEAVKPLLAERNCFLTISDDIIQVGERIYVKATATLHTPTETFSNTAFAREAQSKPKMDDSQVTGSASSYARKYALNGLFAIDDTKDADELNVNDEYTQKVTKPSKQAKPKAVAPDMLTKALAEMKAALDLETVEKVWNSYPDLKNEPQFRSLCAEKGSKFKAKGGVA